VDQGSRASSANGQGPGASGCLEERRVVTTLFCDLVDFTSLSERNDAEVVNTFLRRYYSVARKAVESYGGTVEKYIGDAVVAVFGVPSMHEDDPERAVRAGLRLVDEIDALSGIRGQDVEVRVGINTGESLVRLDIDPASGEGFLTGDAVNVAARLQSAAPPMAVVVGEQTHAATKETFAFDACHPVAVKGKSKPLHAWIATAALARTGSELRSFASAFVGREEELAELEQLLHGAASGRHPEFALISGEPGIGKSRLLAEFARRLDDQPSLVTWRQGRCLPFGANVTFWALSEIVRGCTGVLETDGLARAEARLETVLPDSPDRDWFRARLRPLLGLEAEEVSRDENFAVWREFLEGMASGPTVIVVEDLHWADEAMLAFMDHLTASEAPVPLLVLATARPEVLELAGSGAVFVTAAAKLSLGPLSGEETAELARSRLGAKSLPTDLHALILERSGGNPLFAEELVRLLQDHGLLEERSGKVALKSGAQVPLPDSIGSLIAARLDLLSADRKALLADASIVGRTFWVGAVAAIGERETAAVYEGLIELVAKELVRAERASSMEGETEFTFVHALVCDVAYEQLTLSDRATKHARLAAWLEQRTAGRTEDLAEILAFHYGTALEMAASAGLFELEDQLAEPTERYLSLAGGRAAPLDSASAAAHFARAQRIAAEAVRPKRRFFLSRRARRKLKRRAPMLVGTVAVIAVAMVAALAVYVFRPQQPEPSGPVKLTASQVATKYAPSVVRISGKCPFAVNGRFRWKEVSGSGVVVSKSGLILTSAALFTNDYGDEHWKGKEYQYVENAFYPHRVTVELWDAQGGHERVPGEILVPMFAMGDALIAIDPHDLQLQPVPLGDSEGVRVGQPLVALSRSLFLLSSASGKVTKLFREPDPNGKKGIVGFHIDAAFPKGSHYESPDNPEVVVDSGTLPFLGAPVIDAEGNLVAVVGPEGWPQHRGQQDAGYAVAARVYTQEIDFLGATADQLISTLPFGWSEFSENEAKELGLPVTHGGIVVQYTYPGEAADRAGLRAGSRVKSIRNTDDYSGAPMNFLWTLGGDVIVAIDGKPITTVSRLNRQVSKEPGSTLRLTVLRGHRKFTVTVPVEPIPQVF